MRRSDIASLLPRVIQRSVQPGDPLDALLAAMEGLHEPTERLARDVEQVARPWQAPERMLAYLARWVDVDAVLAAGAAGSPAQPGLPGGAGQLRELICAAAQLAQWRGTARGLALYLRAATGVDGFAVEETVLDERGATRPFVIRVRWPAAAQGQLPLVRRVIEVAKPAYVQCLLEPADPTPPESADA
jgi:phage tail-like protein